MKYDPIRTIQDEERVRQGCYFDLKSAEKVITFIETNCTLSKYPFNGQPLKLLDWQKYEWIYPAYGWKYPDGSRVIKKIFCFVPKKQGKTTFCASLLLYHCLEFQGSNVCCLASNIDQAKNLFDQAKDFIDLNPKLAQYLWARAHIKTIEDTNNKSWCKILSSETSGKQGSNLNYLVVDEVCDMKANQARLLWQSLKHSSMGRSNYMQVFITTAGFDKSHLGYEIFQTAKAIKEGKEEYKKVIDTLPIVYALEETEDWTLESNWEKVNPSAFLTIPEGIKYYRNAFNETKNNPHEENNFKTTLLNIFCGSSLQWIASDVWAGCHKQFNEEELYGLPAIVGIDMARKYDLACYTIAVKKDEIIYLINRFFMPEQLSKQKEKKDPSAQYSRWAKNNFITMTSGDVIDPSVIRASLMEDAQHFNIQEIRFDPYGFEETRQILEAEGFTLNEVPQNYAGMSPATNFMERLIIDKALIHNNPLLDWNAQNCTTKIDTNERIMIDKIKSKGRIDGITSSIIALTSFLGQEEETLWEGSFTAGW